jgi:hypothetical protein
LSTWSTPAHRSGPTATMRETQTMMAVSTFALGMFLFGLFFALVMACDRI